MPRASAFFSTTTDSAMSSETVAAETVVETKTWAVGAAEKIVSHPKVQEALRHPLLQHPALRHPLLADPKVVAIASGLLVILLVLCCELMINGSD